MERTRRSFSREFKIETVRMVTEAGRPVSEVARNLGLAPKLVRQWREALKQEQGQEGREAFPGQGHLQPEAEEVRRLQREVVRLREEREILKKALAIFSGPHRS